MRALPILLGFALLAASATALSTDYRVKDSRLRVDNLAHIYWVDDHRLLFNGRNGREFVRPDGYHVLLESLYLWDIGNGELTDYGDLGGALCYANGYVRFRLWKPDAIGSELGDVIAGPLGHQEKVDASAGGGPLDLETCRPRGKALDLPEWTQGKSVWRLKPEHGFLVLGAEKDERNTPVTYYLNGDREGILMPFKRREFYFPGISYSPPRGAYFIVGQYFVKDPGNRLGGYNRHPWPLGMSIPVWWLYPDGRIETLKLPTEVRFAAVSFIFPARSGIYFVNLNYPSNDGLYKVSNESVVEKILSGFIETYVVSPDGCQIAVNHNQRYVGKRGLGTVKVLDVCP